MNRQAWGRIKDKKMKIYNGYKLLILFFNIFLSACINFDDYRVIHEPQYDYLIGANYWKITKPSISSRPIRELDDINELESKRADGCVLIFGVGKKDWIIKYWRVESGVGTCLLAKKSF